MYKNDKNNENKKMPKLNTAVLKNVFKSKEVRASLKDVVKSVKELSNSFDIYK